MEEELRKKINNKPQEEIYNICQKLSDTEVLKLCLENKKFGNKSILYDNISFKEFNIFDFLRYNIYYQLIEDKAIIKDKHINYEMTYNDFLNEILDDNPNFLDYDFWKKRNIIGDTIYKKPHFQQKSIFFSMDYLDYGAAPAEEALMELDMCSAKESFKEWLFKLINRKI